MPEVLDYDIWRIMASGKFAVPSPSVIENDWTMEDVYDAHEMLDIQMDLETLAHNQSE